MAVKRRTLPSASSLKGIRMFDRILGSLTKHSGRVSSYNAPRWNVPRHHGTGSDNRPFPNGYSGEDECPCSNECVPSNANSPCHQGKGRIKKIVRSRAQADLLGHRCSLLNDHRPQRIGFRAITEAGPVRKSEIPGQGDPSPLMNKGSS